MRCLFLYNPKSGKGFDPSVAVAELSKRYDVETFVPQTAADLTACVRECGHDAVVFAGGDGTFHTVLQAAAGRKITLGYLPTGTMNDVARTVGIPRRLRGALRAILDGHTEQFDCMRVNRSRYCMYLAAAGSITRLSYETPRPLKQRWGRLAYFFHGVAHNLGFKPFPVTVTCGDAQCKTVAAAVFVMNGRVAAGCPVNGEGNMQDGVAEVAVIEHCSHVGEYAALANFLLGGKQRSSRIVTLRGRTVEISVPDTVVWDFDGEEGVRGNLYAEVLPRKITLFAPIGKNFGNDA